VPPPGARARHPAGEHLPGQLPVAWRWCWRPHFFFRGIDQRDIELFRQGAGGLHIAELIGKGRAGIMVGEEVAALKICLREHPTDFEKKISIGSRCGHVGIDHQGWCAVQSTNPEVAVSVGYHWINGNIDKQIKFSSCESHRYFIQRNFFTEARRVWLPAPCGLLAVVKKLVPISKMCQAIEPADGVHAVFLAL